VRAFVLTAPGECSVQEVPAPVAASGEAVVDVDRVGVCGTDVEFFTGEMERPPGRPGRDRLAYQEVGFCGR
jgi:threonine dehydrogenase-like Zn-dependent dehydrogenase